jgi:dihydrodipicolinate synthase/N-acetylneuraminate lyase
MNQLPPIHGVSPVLEVPFHPDGAVDERGFLIVVERVMATGVSSLMFPGFASEYHKLSDAERSHLTRLLLTRTQNHPDLTAIVSVPDQATVLAAARARALADQGADAINLLPPHFLEPSDHAVHDHLSTVLDAVRRCPRYCSTHRLRPAPPLPPTPSPRWRAITPTWCLSKSNHSHPHGSSPRSPRAIRRCPA